MLLAVDVGNTLIKLALYRADARVAHWSVATDRERTADEYAMLWRQFLEFRGFGFSDVSAVAVACVVPQLADTLRRLCRDYLGRAPLEVGPGVRTGMRILYENPREVGADRIACAIAAYARYGGPAIVVALGTATVFTAVSAGGDFLGGAIAPGLGISLDALAQHAAQLRKVELVRPSQVIARNTVAAVQSGVLYGVIGQVEGIVARMREELGARAGVVATGGYAELVGAECRCVDHVDPLLSLDGLRLLYERNAFPGAGDVRAGIQETAG
jgi:type III pantothenate kinase